MTGRNVGAYLFGIYDAAQPRSGSKSQGSPPRRLYHVTIDLTTHDVDRCRHTEYANTEVSGSYDDLA